MNEPMNEPMNEQVNEQANAQGNEAVNGPTNEPPNEAANGPTNEAANGPTNESSNEAANGQADEAVNEPTNEPGADAESDGESENESTDEPDVNAFVDGLAAKLTAADASRFEALVETFKGDEPFAQADIDWIKEVTGLDEALVRYGIGLQREVYKAQLAADTSVADAEAEVGNIDELINFIRQRAPEEKLREWQTIADFAKRTNDSDITLRVLREMKAFKDSLPATEGGRPKTLGHLASSQPKISTEAPKVEKSANGPAEPDALTQLLGRRSSQALASIALDDYADPAHRARAVEILRARGLT